jgi:hypothetical protein
VRLIRSVTRPVEPPLALIYGGVLLLSLGLAALWLSLGLPTPGCPLRELSGVPCPGCGATRLVRSLLEGDPAGAFLHNPLVFLAGAGVAGWALASLLRRLLALPRLRVELTRGDLLMLRAGLAASVALGWLYLVWRGA